MSVPPTESVSHRSRRRSSPTCTASRAPRGGRPRGECCRFHVRWFFPGDRLNSTNEATKRRAAVRNHASVAPGTLAMTLAHMEGARAIDNRAHANAGNTGSCGVLSQQLACWFRSTRKLPVDSACPRSHTLSFSGGKPRGKELPDAEALSTLDDLLVDDYTHTERMTELEGSLGA